MEVTIEVVKPKAADKEMKVFLDAEKLHADGLATYEDCLRALRANNGNLIKARLNLLERLDDLENKE